MTFKGKASYGSSLICTADCWRHCVSAQAKPSHQPPLQVVSRKPSSHNWAHFFLSSSWGYTAFQRRQSRLIGLPCRSFPAKQPIIHNWARFCRRVFHYRACSVLQCVAVMTGLISAYEPFIIGLICRKCTYISFAEKVYIYIWKCIYTHIICRKCMCIHMKMYKYTCIIGRKGIWKCIYMYTSFANNVCIHICIYKTCTACCIWSVITPFSYIIRWSICLGLFCHVPWKRDQ